MNKGRIRFFYISLVLFLPLSIGACSSGKERPVVSDNHMTALILNNRGQDAYEAEDYEGAIQSYLDAFNKSRSLDDRDAIALNALNLASAYRKTGDYDSALKYANYILESKGYSFESHSLASASYIKSLVLLESGKNGESATFADRGLDFCKKGACTIRGALYNVKARIALWAGNFLLAKELARQALKINSWEGNLAEKANSYRLGGDAMVSLKEFNNAKKSYLAALEIDKKLGLSGKIALDLEGSGRSLFNLHSCDEAERYFERALSVLEGDGKGDEHEKVVVLKKMISQCHGELEKNKIKE